MALCNVSSKQKPTLICADVNSATQPSNMNPVDEHVHGSSDNRLILVIGLSREV
jgi:hypothetical protein